MQSRPNPMAIFSMPVPASSYTHSSWSRLEPRCDHCTGIGATAQSDYGGAWSE